MAGYSTKSYTGRPRPEVRPLTVLCTICDKSYPFGIYFLLTNGTPFTYQVNPFVAKCSQRQISTRFPNFILQHFEKQIVPCVSTGRELSFEWSHHRISSTDSNVRATLQNSIKYSGSERVKKHYIPFNCCTCTVFELRMHHKTRKSSRSSKAIKCTSKTVWAFLQTEMTDFPTFWYT